MRHVKVWFAAAAGAVLWSVSAGAQESAEQHPGAADAVQSAAYVVQPGETLWAVARAAQPWRYGISMQQMAWAIFRANRHAFPVGPDYLKSGERLRIPDAAEAGSTSHDVATYALGLGPMPEGMWVHTPLESGPEARVEEVPAAQPVQPQPAQASVQAPQQRFAGSEMERRASELMAGGAFDEAYRVLVPQESRFAGDIRYDYLLGLAALESGRGGEAVLSLQRAVAAEPGFAGARMELARAYFSVGDNEDARREFVVLRAQDPPAAASAAIDRYLGAIDRKADRYRPAWRGALELSGGYDTNANGGAGSDTFLGFELNTASRRAESAFAGAAGSVLYSAPLRPRWRWQAGAVLGHREYPEARFVTSSVATVAAGLRYTRDRWLASAGLGARWLALDGDLNHRALNLDLSSVFAAHERVSLVAGLRVGSVIYEEAVQVQDVDRILANLSLVWRPGGVQRLEMELGPVAGRERARRDRSPYGRDLVGGQWSLLWAGGGGWVWRAVLGYLESDYDGLFFGLPRDDRQFTAQVSLDTPSWFGAWQIRPQIKYVDNRSNLELFEYDRVEFGLHLTRSLR